MMRKKDAIESAFEAIENDDTEALKLIINKNPDVLHKECSWDFHWGWRPVIDNNQRLGSTTLAIFAAKKGRTEALKLMIEKEPSILHQRCKSKTFSYGGFKTPAILAATKGHIEALQLMIKTDASVLKDRDTRYETLAIKAAKNGYNDIIKLLGDIDPRLLQKKDMCWETPLIWARRYDQNKTISLINLYIETTEDGAPPFLVTLDKQYDAIKKSIAAVLEENKDEETASKIEKQLDVYYEKVDKLNKEFRDFFPEYYDRYYCLLIYAAYQFGDQEGMDEAMKYLSVQFEKHLGEDALILFQIRLDQALQEKDSEAVRLIGEYLEKSTNYTNDTPGYADCMMIIGSYYTNFKETDKEQYANASRFFKLAGGDVKDRWESIKYLDEQRSLRQNG